MAWKARAGRDRRRALTCETDTAAPGFRISSGPARDSGGLDRSPREPCEGMLMITVTCDACEKPFQVAPEKAGTKVPCPACGDIKVIPGIAGGPGSAAGSPVGAGGPDRAAALGLPPALGPETSVLKCHSALFRSRPFAALAVFVGAAAGGVGAVVFGINPATWAMAIVCGVVLLACIVIVLAWKVSSWSTRLEVTNKRVIFAKGILSKSTVEMLHRTIQDIEIRQSFSDRLLNVGSITVANASEEDDAILIENVADPYRIRKTIDAYRPM